VNEGLGRLGWSDRWAALFEPHAAQGLDPGRVARADRGSALVALSDAVVRAQPSRRLVDAARGAADLPAVGDWVALRNEHDLDVPLIEAILPRGGTITRGDPGGISDVQVLAANVDTVLVVHPIAEEPNLRRIERELTFAWDSGAIPVVVLTKADLSGDPDGARVAVESVALGVDVVVINARDTASAESLLAYTADQRTAVLLGPSGAGKSTIANALVGEERQTTSEVRAGDQKGRHTTVARELIPLAGGGVLIDTPGLRALGLTASDEGIAAVFSEIDELAQHCRFRDCAHADEPGCAVKAAVVSGTLPADRLASYHKLMRESAVAAARDDVRLRSEVKGRSKAIAKAIKDYYKQHQR
jgi:ribosome biogenesis GTPase / thiamine phosphate phosphatase